MPVSDIAAHFSGPLSRGAFRQAVEISDEGLVCGAGSILAQMTKSAAGDALDIDMDGERVLALLSVAKGQAISPDVMRHVRAASDHWRRGDRALANLRLVFAGLPRLDDPVDALRLSLAEYLVDEGMAPAVLLAELGLAPTIIKYSLDQLRVPAGHGRESGEFAPGSDTASSATHRIVVAGGEGPPEDEKTLQHREATGQASPSEEIANHHPPLILPMGPPIPFIPPALSNAAGQAVEAIGPGRGPVYGTKVHTEFKARVDALGDPNLKTEQSYLNGEPSRRGMPGSVRVDVVEGDPKLPTRAYDLKTGGASLSSSRIKHLQTHMPGDDEIPVHEVRP